MRKRRVPRGGKNITKGASPELSKWLLDLIKVNSGLTWGELERVFGIGRGPKSADRKVAAYEYWDGSEPGNTIQQYRTGKNGMSIERTELFLDIAMKNSWITREQENGFRLDMMFERAHTAYDLYERRWFADLEVACDGVLTALFKHQDVTIEQVLQSVDTIVSPMLKRILQEDIDPLTAPPRESLASIRSQK